MNTDDKNWFSAQQLAKLGAAKILDFPRTERNSRDKARKLGWDEKNVECKGGKNGYMAVFKPPINILNHIHIFLDKHPELFDDIYIPKSLTKPYPISMAAPLVTGDGQHNGLTLKSHSGTDIRVNNFVTPPKYDLQSITTEGHDHVIHSEQIVDYLAFNKEWLDMSLNVRSNCLALISVKDDSMEPTLRSDDLILTDTSRGHIENNSIYVLQVNNELVVKRIQCKVNGTVIVKSDNPVYGEEELDAMAAKSLPVVGKVVWFGRRI